MTNGPFTTIINARNSLNTATNYLGDAIGALVVEDVPVTREQADERMADVERHVRDAERELDRAKRGLGIDGDDYPDKILQFSDDVDVEELERKLREAEAPVWSAGEAGREEHLVCTVCDAHPTVARVHGVPTLGCHCTHVDGRIDGLVVTDLDDMTPLPDGWEFQGAGDER